MQLPGADLWLVHAAVTRTSAANIISGRLIAHLHLTGLDDGQQPNFEPLLSQTLSSPRRLGRRPFRQPPVEITANSLRLLTDT
jgi:hypothetical protein